MSPMIASGSAIRPPAPMPWMARNPASSRIEVENPEAIDPTMKIEIAVMNSGRRPKMSDNLP